MKRLFRTADRRLVGAAVVSGLLLVPLGLFGSSALAHGGPSAAQYQYKVTICHHTHSATNPGVTITVSSSALPAHMRHGDTMGPCGTAAAAGTTAAGAKVAGKKAVAKKAHAKGAAKKSAPAPAASTSQSSGTTQQTAPTSSSPTSSTDTGSKTSDQASEHGNGDGHGNAGGNGNGNAGGNGKGKGHG